MFERRLPDKAKCALYHAREYTWCTCVRACALFVHRSYDILVRLRSESKTLWATPNRIEQLLFTRYLRLSVYYISETNMSTILPVIFVLLLQCLVRLPSRIIMGNYSKNRKTCRTSISPERTLSTRKNVYGQKKKRILFRFARNLNINNFNVSRQVKTNKRSPRIRRCRRANIH